MWSFQTDRVPPNFHSCNQLVDLVKQINGRGKTHFWLLGDRFVKKLVNQFDVPVKFGCSFDLVSVLAMFLAVEYLTSACHPMQKLSERIHICRWFDIS